jgi:opacity protein-like surface antigen
MNYQSSDCRRARARSWGLIAGAVAGAFGLLGSSGAMAQSCAPLTVTGSFGSVPGTIGAVASGLSGANAISGAVTAANTAFLTQSTAFVSAPGNPAPNSDGAGIWIRGVGGDLTLKSNTQVSGTLTPNAAIGGPATGSTNCNSQFHQTFAGFQLGQDVADLNFGSGWNFHVGSTAGYLETSGNIVQGNVQGGAFNSTTQAPFVGSYGVLTKGSFYIDGLVRYDYFETNLNSPTANIFNQQVDAHGATAAFSTGYNYKLPNSNWFVEPSLGFVWSKETVGAINVASPLAGTAFYGAGNYSGSTQVNDIQSTIGRVGARIGTTVETSNLVLQPFVAASVWHDFAGEITAQYSSCQLCFFTGLHPSVLSANMATNNIGTFGQYSVGLSGQLINTGWLGFVRVDYREGPQMVGLSGTGGVRYQFTPTETAAVMPVKAPVYKAPVEAVNWTGYYLGAIGGATTGRGSMDFPFAGAADTRPAGVLGGGTAGYNYQVGKWVYGVEGDVAWTNANGSSQCSSLNSGFVPLVGTNNTPLFQMTCHDSLDWIATAAARIGYAWTLRTLLYAKAGAAVANETFSTTCNLGPLNGSNVFGLVQNCANPVGAIVNQTSASSTAVGYTLGYGTEFAFTQHWTAKAEVDWIDLGHKQFTLSDGTTITTYQRTAQGKVGVNYKF